MPLFSVCHANTLGCDGVLVWGRRDWDWARVNWVGMIGMIGATFALWGETLEVKTLFESLWYFGTRLLWYSSLVVWQFHRLIGLLAVLAYILPY